MKRFEQSRPEPEQAEKSEPIQGEREEEIRRRAYEIFEQRGEDEGTPEQDWLQAEAEVTETFPAEKAA